jgi:hypothetical protein
MKDLSFDLGQGRIARTGVIGTYMVKRSESWRTRSLLSRFAHVVERTGFAMTGGSCGLFVAAHLARSDFNLISSGGAIIAMMIYGAVGFYLGIDLPPGAGEIERTAAAPARVQDGCSGTP